MPERFITEYEIGGFACLKQVRGPLTPLHAFIGPNDSGKSTLLRALRTALHLSSGFFEKDPSGMIRPFDPGALAVSSLVLLRFNPSQGYGFQVRSDTQIFETCTTPKHLNRGPRPYQILLGTRHPMDNPWGPDFEAWLRLGSRFVHFIPAALREPSELIPDDEPPVLADEYGKGLPGIYDRIFSRGDDSVQKIMNEVRRLFPTVRGVRLRNPTRMTKALEVELTSGDKVPAAFLSEGLLFYLAYAALQHLDPVALLLVEEPENGLHPSRIADVMRILREISQTTQVVMATHSPLVINEMKGDEVTLVTRDGDKGTQVRLLSDTPNFAERSQVYALGRRSLAAAVDRPGPRRPRRPVTPGQGSRARGLGPRGCGR